MLSLSDVTHEQIAKILEIGSCPYSYIPRRGLLIFNNSLSQAQQHQLQKCDGVQEIRQIETPYPMISNTGFLPKLPLNIGNILFAPNTFTIIAGPCSVESRSMILETARFLSDLGIPILRGGAFKSRTSPYYFSGYGQEALEDLREAADQFRMKMVTEVVSEDFVSLVSQMADIVQVGSRNAQNFELLKKLGQQNKPVFLKRGFMNTIEEFLLAAEYIALQGNSNIFLCERGVRTFESATRNTLDISAIPLIQKQSFLPIFFDPSHASGRNDIILPLIKAGIAVGANGVMIEVHPHPEKALSDGKQSLNFIEFQQTFQQIQVLCRQLGIYLNLLS